MSIGRAGRTRLLGSTFTARVAQWYNRSLIKNIQRGTVTLSAVASNTASITSVLTQNSSIAWLGVTYGLDADPDTSSSACRVDLTSATVVTGTKNTGSNASVISFEVIEFQPGVLKSVQRGTIAWSGALSATATITTVTPAKTRLGFLGFTTNQVNGYWGRFGPSIVLTDAVTVTASKGIITEQAIVGYEVLEFF